MSTQQIITRLIWKECRQGWILLAPGLLLPPLAVGLTSARAMQSFFNPATIICLLLLLGVVAWAATLGARRPARPGFAAAHFSLHPGLPLLITLLCQGLIVTLIGISVGLWTANPPALPVNLSLMLALGSFLGAFLLTMAVTRAFSLAVGLAAGTIWLLIYVERLLTLPIASANCHPTAELFFPYFPLCALAGLLAFLLLIVPKRESLACRIAAMALVVLIAIGWPIFFSLSSATPDEYYTSGYAEQVQTLLPLATDDGVVTVAPHTDASSPPLTLQFIDHRTQQCAMQSFPEIVRPLGFCGRHTVLLLTQHGDEPRMTFSLWTLDDNTVHSLLTLPARRNVVACHPSWRLIPDDLESSSMMSSPDGRYALLLLPGMWKGKDLQFNRDLWLLDLPHRQAHILRISFMDICSITWLPGRAMLGSNYAGAFTVSLPAGQLQPAKLPSSLEVIR